MEATPEMLNMSSSNEFVRSVFQRGDELGLMGSAQAAPAKPVCPSCGADIKPDQKFCTSCGQKLF